MRGGVVAEWPTSKLVLGLVLVLDAVTTIGAGKGTIVACGAVVWECVLVATEGGACKPNDTDMSGEATQGAGAGESGLHR